MNRLGQEFLNTTRAPNRLLVLIGEFIHSQNCDDVLQVTVALKHALNFTRDGVVFFADDVWVKNRGVGVEWINRRIESEFSQGTCQHDGRIQMRERGRRSRVGQVISRNVHGLNGSDGAFLGRCNAFLKSTHVGRQVRLISHGGRHASEQGRHFGAGLREAENVVDEEENVTPFLITEVLGHRETRESDASASSWRFIHLSEHESGFIENARLFHFTIQIVAFARTFPHSREH